MIEVVLIVILLFSLAQFILNTMKAEWITELLEQPKQYLKGMARSGVWIKAQGNRDLEQHPNVYNRHIMSKGAELE